MPDRRKLAPDEFGRKKNAKEWIVTLLRRKGRMRLKEIREALAENGIVYANNKGLLLALESLIESERIEKEQAKPYPYYRLSDHELTNIEWIAEAFRDGVSNPIVNDYANRPVPKDERSKESMIHDAIQVYGAYMLYVHIQSFKIIDPKKSFLENRDLRHTWIFSTIPFGHEPLWFEKIVARISGIPVHISVDEQGNPDMQGLKDFPDMLLLTQESDRKMKGLAEIEEILKSRYPDYYGLFNKAWQKAPKLAESRKEYRSGLKTKKAGKND